MSVFKKWGWSIFELSRRRRVELELPVASVAGRCSVLHLRHGVRRHLFSFSGSQCQSPDSPTITLSFANSDLIQILGIQLIYCDGPFAARLLSPYQTHPQAIFRGSVDSHMRGLSYARIFAQLYGKRRSNSCVEYCMTFLWSSIQAGVYPLQMFDDLPSAEDKWETEHTWLNMRCRDTGFRPS